MSLMAETRRFEEEVSQASVYHLPKLINHSNHLDFLERRTVKEETYEYIGNFRDREPMTDVKLIRRRYAEPSVFTLFIEDQSEIY